ncbi:TonB-dependent receptor [Tunturibacter empetritectus]
MVMSKCFRVVSLVLFVALVVSSAFAQTTNARLSGTVRDSAGAVIPDATLTITNLGTNQVRTLRSGAEGQFADPSLIPGSYRVTIEHAGFQKSVQTGVVLNVSQDATLNVTLNVGNISETVNVEAGVELINTTTAEISSVVDQHAVSQLPLNGRDPSSLVFLAPGVTNVLNTGGGALQGGFAFPTETGGSANGGRQGSTYYLLDGVPNMDTYLLLAAPFPNADATQEFRVISNNFDARYGFAPGAVVTIQTKSGTNDFHGGAFEFLRNNVLNASNYFTGTVDSLKRNQFGGYIGGPIIKNKLFFFVNYQGTRSSSAAATNVTYTPTAAMLNGDFSAVPQPITAPGFVNNRIDPSLFSPAALAIAKTALPLGQDPATGQVNYQSGAIKNQFDEGTGKLDWVINDRQHLVARAYINYFNQAAGTINGNILSVLALNPYTIIQGNPQQYYNGIASHNWVIDAKTVNVFSAFWTQMSSHSSAAVKDINGQDVCLSRYTKVNEEGCYIEGLNVTNGFSTGYTEPSQEIRTTIGLSDTLTRTVGRNTYTFGVDVWHQYAKEFTQYPTQPIESFYNSTGFGLADFLLGRVGGFTQGAGEIANVVGWQLGLYAQDQFKLKPNLTLTAGLRWDPNVPPASQGGRGSVFVPGQKSTVFPNAPTGLVFPGDKGISDGLMKTTYGYFEPRIGIAFQPRSLPNTVFRAGFGLFTAPLSYSTYNHTADIAPFSPTYTVYANYSNGSCEISFDDPYASPCTFNGVAPFPPYASVSQAPPSNSAFPSTVTVPATFSPDFKLGVTQSWNASVEQQFPGNLAMHLAYVGSESYHQTTVLDQNPGVYSATNPAISGSRTIYPAFGQILTDTSIGTANYQSLQAGLEKKFSHNLQFQSNFTWSHTIDLTSSGNISFGNPALPNPFDIRYNRGDSLLNIPLISATNFVYTTPGLRNTNPFVRYTLGSWEVSGIFTIQSGFPFTVSAGGSNNNSGAQQYSDRADIVPSVPVHIHQGSKVQWLQQYFNPAAFQPNAPGTFGNSPKNGFRGPGTNTADAALIKNWQVHERYGMQFRFELFNAFNHPSFGNPNTSLSAGNVGAITSIGSIPPRVGQAAIKLSF